MSRGRVLDAQTAEMSHQVKNVEKYLLGFSKRGSMPPCFLMRRKRKPPSRTHQTSTMPASSFCRGVSASEALVRATVVRVV